MTPRRTYDGFRHTRPCSLISNLAIKLCARAVEGHGMPRKAHEAQSTYPYLDGFTDQLEELPRRLRQKPSNSNAQPTYSSEIPTWDEYFHAIAQVVALRSKDEKKVGAVIVGNGHAVLSTGFNGFARGIRETPTRAAEDEKLMWVTHAETNAIFNAARNGVSLVGSTIYVTFFPCSNCAQAIVQSGITRVFTYGSKYWVKTEPDSDNRWEIALDILAEAHVAVDAPHLRREEARYWVEKKRAENKKKGTLRVSRRR